MSMSVEITCLHLKSVVCRSQIVHRLTATRAIEAEARSSARLGARRIQASAPGYLSSTTRSSSCGVYLYTWLCSAVAVLLLLCLGIGQGSISTFEWCWSRLVDNHNSTVVRYM